MAAPEEEPTPARAPTPVTVLSGALGAGKTTLLKYVLEQPHGYRVAVIQNEFSEEMGIEGPLITDANGETFKDIVELPNGCLCCSAKDGLINALDNLLEERQRFDYVLVEATGVADPEAICEIFWVDEELGSRVYLDGVVTLVDCQNAPALLAAAASEVPEHHSSSMPDDMGLQAESAKQVACADVLILNKVDLVPESDARDRVRQRLTAINPTAVMLETTRSVVPLGEILGIKAFGRQRLEESIARLGVACSHETHHEGCESCENHAHGHGHQHAHEQQHGSGHQHGHGNAHQHDQDDVHMADAGHEGLRSKLLVAPSHGIESILLRGDPALACYDEAKVNAWLADVLWENSAGNVYRCKGIFRGPDGTGYALQGVGRIFEVEEVPRELFEVQQSKLLFIGRKLNQSALTEGLRRCAVADSAAENAQ
eukprot:TRINITY_DN13753_c0_g1_i3.p1 TRINITY_DN13753_c0_g1~~TRINITY_DN13753_c0_g1_i3.p1  ORF type:complete len:448 (+),score=87.83 TRINITY_DN13753_c0_g1_i3:63-1346(+)